jgi:hypothetical protein
LILALGVGGCAAPSKYEWNQYDQRLYDYYKNPATEADFVKSMEAHVLALEAAGRKPAPGIYAELGTFYLKRGNSKLAVQYYEKERAAWPESKGLMTAMINNINKSTEEKQ